MASVILCNARLYPHVSTIYDPVLQKWEVINDESSDDMRFVARQEDDLWYIALFKGRTIRGTSMPDGVWKPFVFQTATQARECAKALNARFIKHYEKNGSAYVGHKKDQEMIECIQSHLPTTPIKRRIRA